MRSDLHALLQPRAQAITVHGKGSKGTGKKGDKDKGKGIIPTITKTPNDLKLAAAMQDLATKTMLAIQQAAMHKQAMQICTPLGNQTAERAGMRAKAPRCNA